MSGAHTMGPLIFNTNNGAAMAAGMSALAAVQLSAGGGVSVPVVPAGGVTAATTAGMQPLLVVSCDTPAGFSPVDLPWPLLQVLDLVQAPVQYVQRAPLRHAQLQPFVGSFSSSFRTGVVDTNRMQPRQLYWLKCSKMLSCNNNLRHSSSRSNNCWRHSNKLQDSRRRRQLWHLQRLHRMVRIF